MYVYLHIHSVSVADMCEEGAGGGAGAPGADSWFCDNMDVVSDESARNKQNKTKKRQFDNRTVDEKQKQKQKNKTKQNKNHHLNKSNNRINWQQTKIIPNPTMLAYFQLVCVRLQKR